MRLFKQKRLKKFFVIASILLLFAVITAPSGLEASLAGCTRAYIKCGSNAAILSMANPALGAGWAMGCMIGYAWCLEFF